MFQFVAHFVDMLSKYRDYKLFKRKKRVGSGLWMMHGEKIEWIEFSGISKNISILTLIHKNQPEFYVFGRWKSIKLL